jgi:hypothetical protein
VIVSVSMLFKALKALLLGMSASCKTLTSLCV